MLPINVSQLHEWMNAFLWPFLRILAVISASPLLGESSIPVKVKIGLAAAMAAVIAPALAPVAIPIGSASAFLLAAQQIVIGVAMGLMLRIAFAAVQTAGELIGLQMGLSFATFFDPNTGAQTAVLSRIMNMMAMLLFLALEGHLIMLAGVARSFELLPLGAGRLDVQGLGVLLAWSSRILMSGMLLALPLIIILLTISLALGILNRTAQQLSVFAVGFPVSLLTGLALLAAVIPQTAPFLSSLFEAAQSAMADLAMALAGP